MEFFAITDVGLIRDVNQDSYLTLTNQYGEFLALVCDGIGGGKAGDIASGETIKYFSEVFPVSGPFDSVECMTNFLQLHINKANKKVHELSKAYEEYQGMGTTITGIMISKCGLVSLNIGDSRVYGFKDDKVFNLTFDDTLVNQMLAEGKISLEEAINHPKRHYLTKAIGILDDIQANIHKIDEMDYYLICSDGLHGFCAKEEIQEIILKECSVAKKVEDMKDLALLKGGYDNITVILVKR